MLGVNVKQFSSHVPIPVFVITLCVCCSVCVCVALCVCVLLFFKYIYELHEAYLER